MYSDTTSTIMDVSTLGFNDTDDFINATVATIHHRPPARMLMTVIKVVYAIGIIGNATAIVALRYGEKRVRNRKHLLLLTSLAANDLVALIGMMCAMLVAAHVPGARDTRMYCVARVVLRVFGIGSVCIAVTMALERYLALTRPFLYQKSGSMTCAMLVAAHVPGARDTRMYCVARVVLRVFGIGSVCIAVTMALERYLALTRPFLYQKQVTYFVIRLALFVSWFWAAVLTCAPVFGLGLYYDEQKCTCTRYRNAVTTVDFTYAVFYVAFGTLLCLILVYCNLAVIQALYSITAPRAGGQPVVRRVSRSSCRQRSLNSGSKPSLHHNAATAEEVAFSRLMATLSVLFMICWLPQMVTSALYLALGPTKWAQLATLANLSDMLMLLNYVLNPILYVLMRQRRTIYHTIAHCFKGSHKTSTESMTLKNSCCPQETLVVSDSSGAEMKPLRPLPPSCQTPLVKIED